MHEAAISQSIVKTVLNEAKKQNAIEIESVEIEIGDLTFLGIDQIEFWVKTSFQGTIAEDADIKFKIIKGALRCTECNYEGNLKIKEDPIYHMSIPAFACPKCKSSKIEITHGREAFIRRIKIRKN